MWAGALCLYVCLNRAVVLSWHACCDKDITLNMFVHTLYLYVPLYSSCPPPCMLP